MSLFSYRQGPGRSFPRGFSRAKGAVRALCLLLGALVASTAHAQTDPKVEPLKLSAHSDQVLAALKAVGTLPAEEWRVHTGDMAHGEAPDLDDRAWTTIKAPYVTGADAVWFRRTIIVPKSLAGYDPTGAAVSFTFNIWTPGPAPVIVYFDGRRVAMGEQLEPISLFAHAKPGQRIVVAVKALATPDAKHFDGADVTVSFSPKRPNPNDLRLEALSATYLLPALETTPGHDRAVLEHALAAVDLAALKAGRQQTFDASLRVAESRIAALKPIVARAQYHLAGDAHIDAAWTWPWTETVDVVRRTFGTSLQLMREYPDYTYSQSVGAYYDWMAEKYPSLNAEIRQRVKEGRWEVVGGMWIEPDLNMPDGESLVRQILIGKRFMQQQYGVDVRIGWNPDSFGFNWQLPQIYKKAGIDYFVTQKMDWNDTNELPLKLFWWQAPDGSRVLTYFPHNYTNFTEPDRLAQDLNIARRKNPGFDDLLHLYGIGDHGGGPTRAMLDTANHWMAPGKVFGPAHYGTTQAYFDKIEPRLDTAHAPIWTYADLAAGKAKLGDPPKGEISLPVWNDELYLEYCRGTFTSQTQEKRDLRETEEGLLNAEKWSALDGLEGAPYPAAELTSAWKLALFNQSHDTAAGSAVGVVYKDAARDYAKVRLTTAKAQADAQGDLAAHIDTRAPAGAVPILVWNPLSWTRSETATAEVELPTAHGAVEVVDDKGLVVPSQPALLHPEGAGGARETISFLAKDVPSLGYRTFYARGVAQSAADLLPLARQDAATVVLENARLKLVIDTKDGCIVHLIGKADGFDAIAPGGCGNQLQTFVDKPKAYDAWNIDPGTLDHMTPITALSSLSLVENGPLRATVKIVRHWGASTFAQEISLARDADEVVVDNDVDWHERHVLLKAAFPLAASGPEATYEIPYGSIARPTTRANSWDAARFEVPALRWADLGDRRHGFSLINEAKYGYDAKDNVLRLSLLRAPTNPDPDADQGRQRFAYALYPHAGDWREALTVRHGYDFNYRLTAEQVAPHPGAWAPSASLISLDGDRTLVLTAVKRAEDSDRLMLRFYEWGGASGTATVRFNRPVVGATETDLMERNLGKPLTVSGDSVAVRFSPFAITTLAIDVAAQPAASN
jgi:alpha-mannosidase